MNTDLVNEITTLIEARIGGGEPVAATWVTQEIVGLHPDVRGEDAPWYRSRAYDDVRAAVRHVVRSYKPAVEGTDEQLLLPGFERLQKAYLVSRDGDQIVVPTNQLTDEEVDAKVGELRRMAEGCHLHADELIRYRKTRSVLSLSAAIESR